MRPAHLKFPFTWEERRPVIIDQILYVPKYFEGHRDWAFPRWEKLFGREAPLHAEYCTGNGAWIIEKALQHPEWNWIAIEKRFERIRKIWSKRHNLQLSNLFIVCGEALTFTRDYVPSHSFDAAYVNFPDPWPKDKHAKNRLLQGEFIAEMARACKPSAQATIATDHLTYAEQIAEEMRSHPNWESVFPSPFYVTEWENYGESYFENLWREQGLTIQYLQFLRRGQ